ncbi:MAG: type II secretion system protein [Armatimonadetes bacterium]|jgi:prepilin-type N-terminal cleavage/methylation domain-containing protein|nr:type II secretion system protein [Armatimonadota bacterium]
MDDMLRPGRCRAFTLIELLVVIAIIAVLASVAIRPLLRARQASCESAAMQVLRSLQKAEVQRKTQLGSYGNLDALAAAGASPVAEGESDPNSDYVFRSTVDTDTYTIVAEPPKSHMRTYTLVETGVITGE